MTNLLLFQCKMFRSRLLFAVMRKSAPTVPVQTHHTSCESNHHPPERLSHLILVPTNTPHLIPTTSIYVMHLQPLCLNPHSQFVEGVQPTFVIHEIRTGCSKQRDIFFPPLGTAQGQRQQADTGIV